LIVAVVASENSIRRSGGGRLHEIGEFAPGLPQQRRETRLAQQILEAFPWNAAPTYLVRDNDRAYGRPSRVDFGRLGYATARSHRGRLAECIC
jgi:hypothetical protein